mgnify:CR=1 FL=1
MLFTGDSLFPDAPYSGASQTTATVGSAVFAAAQEWKRRLGDHAPQVAGQLADALCFTVSTEGAPETGSVSQSFGAHFCEVAVDAVTGEVRVRRMLGVFDVGRVLNEKTAANQIVGGMVWGVSYALGEAAVVDTRSGRFVNPDFGEYHVAVNADVPQIEVHFIEEIDDAANQVGAKGVGELGISGAGAAVINAIHNATGVRVRDVPATLDTLLAGLRAELTLPRAPQPA